MQKDHDKEKCAALIKEAQAITAGLKSEITELGTQLGRVLVDREADADEVGPTVAPVMKDVRAEDRSGVFGGS
jgi:hypothetical protein